MDVRHDYRNRVSGEGLYKQSTFHYGLEFIKVDYDPQTMWGWERLFPVGDEEYDTQDSHYYFPSHDSAVNHAKETYPDFFYLYAKVS